MNREFKIGVGISLKLLQKLIYIWEMNPNQQLLKKLFGDRDIKENNLEISKIKKTYIPKGNGFFWQKEMKKNGKT